MDKTQFSDITYKQFLNEEKLMGSKCEKCGIVYAPPRPICVNCYGTDMSWVEMKGKGNLSAFTCIAVGPPSMVAEGYDRKNPYCSGIVKLEEGPSVVARIEGVDTKDPESINIGLPLTVKFLHKGEGEEATTVLAFESQ